jgi:hypothetical protein
MEPIGPGEDRHSNSASLVRGESGYAAKAADLIVLLLIVAVAAILALRIADPLDVRTDSWSEAEAMISGMGHSANLTATEASRRDLAADAPRPNSPTRMQNPS